MFHICMVTLQTSGSDTPLLLPYQHMLSGSKEGSASLYLKLNYFMHAIYNIFVYLTVSNRTQNPAGRRVKGRNSAWYTRIDTKQVRANTYTQSIFGYLHVHCAYQSKGNTIHPLFTLLQLLEHKGRLVK